MIDVFNTKQQSITEKIKEILQGEDIQTEYKVPGLDYRIDIYFHEYKQSIEGDEFGHCDRDNEYEKERERKLKEMLDFEFIRINADESNFSINRAMKEIYRHNIKSVEKLAKGKTK